MTGKTRQLTEQFIRYSHILGLPSRIAAVTYTRAGARELKTRIAAALELASDERTLAGELPFVGTIHSIAYRLLDLKREQIVNGRKFREFCDWARLAPPKKDEYFPHPEELEGFWWGELTPNSDEADILRRTVAASKHRLGTIADALAELPHSIQESTSLPRLELLAKKYEEWKKESGLYDYEDLLLYGAQHALPVQLIFLDEAQDQSPLMWKVVDSWAEGAGRLVSAGDFFQAIYQFTGASPHLFLDRPGTWVKLDTSHRLDDGSVRYAQNVLESGGWTEGREFEWHGAGGEGKDGSKFYLARTHALLAKTRNRLYQEGVPYLEFRGRSPWASKPGDAYRTLTALINGEVVLAKVLAEALDAFGPGQIQRGAGSRIIGLRGEVGAATCEAVAGAPLEQLRDRLQYADYFARILRKEGLSGLFRTPKVRLGSTHASKGAEADEVNLIRSWGVLPGQRLYDQQGKKEESLVAYVAVTRHRVRLNIIDDGGYGESFPWPARGRR